MDDGGGSRDWQKKFHCFSFPSVCVRKCPDKSNLREKRIILAHSSSTSIMLEKPRQQRSEEVTSQPENREHEYQCSVHFINLTIQDLRTLSKNGSYSSVNLITPIPHVHAHKCPWRFVSLVSPHSTKLTKLSITPAKHDAGPPSTTYYTLHSRLSL